jgi:hypothetical protein
MSGTKSSLESLGSPPKYETASGALSLLQHPLEKKSHMTGGYTSIPLDEESDVLEAAECRSTAPSSVGLRLDCGLFNGLSGPHLNEDNLCEDAAYCANLEQRC